MILTPSQMLRIRHRLYRSPLPTSYMPHLLQIRRLHPPLHQQLHARPHLHRHERRAMGQPGLWGVESDCRCRFLVDCRSLLLACRCQETGVYWKQDFGWTGYCADDCVVPTHYCCSTKDLVQRLVTGLVLVISSDCRLCALSKIPPPVPFIHCLSTHVTKCIRRAHEDSAWPLFLGKHASVLVSLYPSGVLYDCHLLIKIYYMSLMRKKKFSRRRHLFRFVRCYVTVESFSVQ